MSVRRPDDAPGARWPEAAARDPRVNRIFVTAPVKLQMCADAGRGDARWLRKIRPWWGHHDHFHVRLNCPTGAPGCVDPDPVPAVRELAERGALATTVATQLVDGITTPA